MFANSYQTGCISIFYSCGSNPLAIWDKQVKNGHIRRVVDEDVKSLVLEIGGVNVATTYITCPIKPRASLGIKLPFLIMIIKNMKKYFSFQIQIMDDKGMHRSFRVSNFQSATKVQPFFTTMPIGLSAGWNQVQFNLADFTKRAYGTTYQETTRVQIHANVRIRRIYFSDQLYSEEEMPNEFKLFAPSGKKAEKKEEKIEAKTEAKQLDVPPLPSPVEEVVGVTEPSLGPAPSEAPSSPDAEAGSAVPQQPSITEESVATAEPIPEIEETAEAVTVEPEAAPPTEGEGEAEPPAEEVPEEPVTEGEAPTEGEPPAEGETVAEVVPTEPLTEGEEVPTEAVEAPTEGEEARKEGEEPVAEEPAPQAEGEEVPPPTEPAEEEAPSEGPPSEAPTEPQVEPEEEKTEL